MGYDRKPIDTHKKQIVQELFVNTADDNYITARWCLNCHGFAGDSIS